MNLAEKVKWMYYTERKNRIIRKLCRKIRNLEKEIRFLKGEALKK